MNLASDLSKKPMVTIGLPAYNSEKFIHRAMDSLLGQTLNDFTLIISDDASEDTTQDICTKYAAADGRVRYIRQPKNLGRSENFRFLVYQADTPFFMWAAHDDWWDHNFLKNLTDALMSDKDQKYGLAFCSARRINPDESLKEEIIFSGNNAMTDQSHAAIFRRMVSNEIIHLTFNGLWRTNFIKKLISRPVAKSVKWDRTLMAEAALGTRFISIEPVLYVKRIIGPKIREQNNPEWKLHAKDNPFRYSKYLVHMVIALISSPVIPIYRKPLAVLLWIELAWRERKRIFWVGIRDIRRLLAYRA